MTLNAEMWRKDSMSRHCNILYQYSCVWANLETCKLILVIVVDFRAECRIQFVSSTKQKCWTESLKNTCTVKVDTACTRSAYLIATSVSSCASFKCVIIFYETYCTVKLLRDINRTVCTLLVKWICMHTIVFQTRNNSPPCLYG